MEKNNLKTEQIAFRCTKDFRERIEKAAEKEHRTLSNYIELALIEKLEKN